MFGKISLYLVWLVQCLFIWTNLNAQTTYTIHLLDPWNSEENGKLVHVRGGGPPGYYPGIPLTSEGGGWYGIDITFTASELEYYYGFWFVSYNPNIDYEFLAADGLTTTAPTEQTGFIYLDVFEESPSNDLWIIPNAGAPPTVSVYPPDSKIIHLLNPWPQGNPQLIYNDSIYKPMLSSYCGWLDFPYINPGNPVQALFQDSFSGEYYGATGLGDTNSIDLTSIFASSDTVYVQPTPQPNSKMPAGPPEIKTTYPGIKGLCELSLGYTARDFSADHPDFEFSTSNQYVIPGMILPTLGEDNKPQKNTGINDMADGVMTTRFQTWFNTSGTNENDQRKNYQFCKTFQLHKTRDGYWEYSSQHEPSRSFFPLDTDSHLPNENVNPNYSSYSSNYQPFRNGEFQMQWIEDPTGGLHNFHFTMELHAEFTYNPNQKLIVGGDDDIWVFINNELVLDLGGTHIAAHGEILLDNLNLEPNKSYPIDFFLCERKTTASHLIFKTNIFLRPPSNPDVGRGDQLDNPELPNCNLLDSSSLSIGPDFSNLAPKSQIWENKKFRLFKQSGYPIVHFPEKNGYYGPNGVFLGKNGDRNNPEK